MKVQSQFNLSHDSTLPRFADLSMLGILARGRAPERGCASSFDLHDVVDSVALIPRQGFRSFKRH